ncbi:copper chaperone PCu(A)C [Aerophototrophica crusticola]|uniref:Copper chaperone PCu(A)C n=1 Tax=Aerophototrophica crusticola TaxID=1709002 RepID=A0A858R8E7_9PROT|nr:copper chaperone PCu(A)C [Rhodospirillaceae bacterium B3]
MLRRAFLALALLTAAGPALAHSYKGGDVMVGHPWAEPADGPQATAFVALLNGGKQADKLLRASTPRAAKVEIRDLVGGKPAVVPSLEVKPNAPVAMRPGARDLLLTGLTQPLKLGDKFPLVLEFEKGGKVEVEVFVETAPGH